jgi:hypothetical protein
VFAQYFFKIKHNNVEDFKKSMKMPLYEIKRSFFINMFEGTLMENE